MSNQQPTLRGSWDQILEEADRMAAAQNDAAVPLYEKVIERLAKLSPARRAMADGLLQNTLLRALHGLMRYSTMRARYDHAIALLTQIRGEMEEEVRADWDIHRASLLFLDGRADEGVATLRSLIELRPDEIGPRSALALYYGRLERYEEAAGAVTEMKEYVQQLTVATDEGFSIPEARAMVMTVESSLAMDQGQWERAIALMQAARLLDPDQRSILSHTYIRLIHAGQYVLARDLIGQDEDSAIRTNFWRGFIAFHEGHGDDAKRHWQRALKVEIDTDTTPALVELILTHYYLGDKEGTGLSAVLHILEEGEQVYWEVLMLAGLGWGLRKSVKNMRFNIERAMLTRRASGEAAKLPHENWSHCVDLLEEELLEEIHQFFDTEEFNIEEFTTEESNTEEAGDEATADG